MPAVLSLFPEQGLVARSQKYINQAPLGHDFLAPAYMAAYLFNGKESTLAISQGSSPQEAGQKVQRLRSHFARSGKVTPQPATALGAYRGSNPFEGDVIFFGHGPYVVLFVNPPPNADVVLKKLLAVVPEAR